jgi:hypothetical protein
VVSLVNGRLVGNDRLELSGLCRVMLTSWRTLRTFITESFKQEVSKTLLS